MKWKVEPFGSLDGMKIVRYTLTNDQGIQVSCLNYGCIITELLTPNINGQLENVVLGFDSLENYLKDASYLGGVVGRVAGRIEDGIFEINGTTFQLNKNNGPHHLHGGERGLNRRVWIGEIFQTKDRVGIHFTYESPDGEEGYPGHLKLRITYTLSNKNEFTLEYEGFSDTDTLLNLSNHSYFNLSGNNREVIHDQELTLKSSTFLEMTEECLPTGQILQVDESPFDFRAGSSLGKGIQSHHPQIQVVGNGYDHYFVLDSHFNREIILVDPKSGRKLIVETDQPGVVVYTGNFLSEVEIMRSVRSKKYLGVCFETQGYPNAPRQSSFPSITLLKNRPYQAKTVWKFGLTGGEKTDTTFSN